MAKTAAKTGGAKKGKAAKPAPAKEAALGAVLPEGEVETKAAADVGVSKDASTIEATGKFEVVEVGEGKFRMFNDRGQAVSDVVSKEDTLENGKPALAKLIRDSRRSNALRKQREIRTPRGHEAAA